ncbi:hypothetical protein HXX76_003612 [Chlamydomonas incerta]|uniref:Uncharacterized protein n=1 Tax=Chlamydomonas incerta TaxID=51695 RepID=A0A835W626_CHLIN|nr:hypothetical protein HXX76_003612 [Chlamydomonas incerta]|eukprot:KAG2440755.1 hypothetical protein HXX76_003612 [Chlamydomonas incerta]
MGRNERRGQPGAAGSQAAPGTPSPRHLADEAETLQQQGERRKGLEAAAKFEAAAAMYRAALEAVVRQRQQLGLALGPPDGATALAAPPGGRRGGGGGGAVTLSDAIDMRSGLAECHQLLGEALLAAAEARPDSELSGAEERRAAGAAIRQYATAAGHYACCHEAAVLTAPAPGAAEVAAAAAAGSLEAAASNAFAAASAVAAAASAAAGSLGADVAVNAGNSLAALGEQLEEEATAAVGGGGGGGVASSSGGGGGAGPLGWLAQYDVAVRCFRAAAACYRSAEAQEEDALTLSNLADVLIQTGTCLHAVAKAVREAPPEAAAAALAAAAGGGTSAALVGDWAAAREAEAGAEFASALAAYESACSHTDSSQGDDLPGLLCNWSAGLLGMAGCLQDPAARLPLLQQAAGRLEHAASFDRADPAPLCSLGDVLAAAGEAAEALARAAAAAAGPSGAADAAAAAAAAAAVAAAGASGAGAPAAAAVHWRGVAAGHMAAALERGYGAALRLRADEPEALVGAGEVHLALARLSALELSAAAAAAAAAGGSDGGADSSRAAAEAARRHVEAAVGALWSAVSRPERLGGWRQRCDVRYNLACALVLAGRDQEAAALFGALLRCGALRAAELAADPDLQPLRAGGGGGGLGPAGGQGAAWFAALLQEAAAMEASGGAAGHV